MHIAPLTLKAQLVYLVSAAAIALTLTLLGFLAWRSTPMYHPAKTVEELSSAVNTVGMIGIITFFTLAGLTVALLFECSQYFVRYAFHPTHSGRDWLVYQHAAVAAQACLGLAFFLVGVVSFVRWSWDTAQCGFLFCTGLQRHPFAANFGGESFDVFLSLLLLLTLVPLSFVLWYRVYTLWQLQRAVRVVITSDLESGDSTPGATSSPKAAKGPEGVPIGFVDLLDNNVPFSDAEGCPLHATSANPMAKPPSMRACVATPWKKQLSRIVGLCAGIVACAVLSFWLPNQYEFFPAYGIAYYTQLSVSRGHRSSNTTVPEMPYAWFRTRQVRLSPDLVLKLFPGNVFFYVYLLSAAVIVFVLRQTQTGRYWMQRRIPQCACFTYGEAAFMAATAWLAVFFFIYWMRDHNFKASWTADAAESMPVESAERWARALGQLAILFLSLLLLPVGRQSVVVTVLGVSRDGLLWFHRAVGYAMLAATLGHIIAFYCSYAYYGLLWENLNKIPNVVGRKGIAEDYTVVAATWTTWFMLIAMGIFGLNAVRRRYYELFYYTHLAATYMTLPMMLFHASAGWMYMLPGLTVFLADQLVRVWQRSAVVRVVHARTISEDTVELAFSVPGRWDMRRVHPGQYVLVCVPELTALQWHPFTLTSVVDDDDNGGGSAYAGGSSAVGTTGTVFYLHIKSMGPRTWTGRLYDMVRSGQVFSVGVEGPCGTPVDYSRYDDIVLVAGGIGAAPCVSVYGSLLRAYVRNGGCGAASGGSDSGSGSGGVPRVRMVWSTRSASLVGAVADMLQLPVSYRGLLRMPKSRRDAAQDAAADAAGSAFPTSAAAHHNATTVEVPASDRVRNEDFTLDVYVTRTGELHKFAALDHKLHAGTEAGRAREPNDGDVAGVDASLAEEQQRERERGAVNRGARLRVYEGRPDVCKEIAKTFTNPATGEVEGDVRRKLVLVCGPEGLVSDAISACAKLGVAVHTEEFLF